jgi:hypothetical protein
MHGPVHPLALLAVFAIAIALGALYVGFICIRNLVRWIREEFRK